MKKTNFRTWGLLALVGVVVLSLSSCATIVSGGSPKIILDGDVDEHVTIVTEKQVYNDVTLPYQVKVNRHAIDGQRITIKSDNYEYKDVMLEKKVNEWAFGNIIFGGLIGWGVDLLTNCVSKPSHTRYSVIKTEKQK